MLVKSLQIRDHPGIGDLDLDFTDAKGNPFRTVVLAGGNGTGKTAILEILHGFMEGDGYPPGASQLIAALSSSEMEDLHASTRSSPSSGYPADVELSSFQGSRKIAWTDPNGSSSSTLTSPRLAAGGALLRSFYSGASVSFRAPQPGSITSTDIDDIQIGSIRSSEELGREISQLLVDIIAADAEDIRLWVQEHPGQVPPEEVGDRRFRRFRRAFEFMFQSKRFRGVQRSGGLRVEFEEHGRISSLEQLSTGEKQVVFRAGFVLRHLAATRASIVLIDEPELSLSPEWQARILGFYGTFLSDENGVHPQIFVATHSPFIVHGAANAKVIILEKDPATGAVRPMPEPAYPAVGGSEAVRAFNIDTFLKDAQNRLVVMTEGTTDEDIIDAAWRKLRPGRARPFDLWPAFGAKNINIHLNSPELIARLGNRLILAVFDFDRAFDWWKGVWSSKVAPSTIVSASESAGLVKKLDGERAWAMLLPVPAFRADFASQKLGGNSILSIEFLFEHMDIPSAMLAYKELPLAARQPYVPDGQKHAFAAHVATLESDRFHAFEPLLQRVEDILAGKLV